jgi:pimeloyl-ACP methyl ester carboxylesterase
MQERMSITAQRIEGPAGQLHVDDGGTGGVPVVFVHSFAGSGSHWTSQLAHARATRRAVTFDLRGHGRSTPPSNNDYRIESLAEDLAAVIDGLQLERVVLVGHGLGASVSAAYASEQPERVGGLLLVVPPGKVPGDQAQKTIQALESDFGKVSAAYYEKLLSGARPNVRSVIMLDAQRLPRETALALIKASQTYDPVSALQRYEGPKLSIVTPSSDTPLDLHNVLRDLPRVHMDGTSHWPQLDKPDEFNRHLDEFLAQIR